jgi:hypothetical protein
MEMDREGGRQQHATPMTVAVVAAPGPIERFDRMSTNDADTLISLPSDRPIWDRIFGVFPLIIVGS